MENKNKKKYLLILGLNLILLVSYVLTSCSIVTTQKVSQSKIRSINIDNQTVEDYTGIYSIENNKIYKNKEELPIQTRPTEDTVLNKIDDMLYFNSNDGYIIYSISNTSISIKSNINNNNVYVTPKGAYVIKENSLIFKNKSLLTDIVNFKIIKNSLYLETYDDNYIVNLSNGEIIWRR